MSSEILNADLLKQVSQNQDVSMKQLEAVLELLESGSTVPFIARYRKEVTGGLDEEQIRAVYKEYEYSVSLAKRKEDVLRLIDEKGKLTDEIKQSVLKATKLSEIEDIYRPYKEKKKTRATEAKRLGLEPLANYLLLYPMEGNVEEEASKYLTDEVLDVESALQGAKDIVSELISDNAKYRAWIKEHFMAKAEITSAIKKNAKDEKNVYEQYYDYSEPLSKIVPHRILALNRGEKEKILNVSIKEDKDYIIRYLNKQFIVKPESIATPYLEEAIDDAYKRLMKPSIERELRSEMKEKAEQQAIMIFSENLRSLLLQAPLKDKIVLGVDPAYRTGCKLAVVDTTSKVLDIGVIYPHQKFVGENVNPARIEQAKKKVVDLIKKFDVEIVAIGNGTASRETEQFISDVIKEASLPTAYVIVNEAGASVYSASDLARKEFPDFEVEERSAVSIARRLQDPLSELVKIDPKSIGVGQYQHDVSQKELNESLTFVVETAVNQVGVNINTASVSLLQYVSGLSAKVAENMVAFRDEVGKFVSRPQIKKVPKLGPKAYEQAVGFLRILDGKEPLDGSGIHPESYNVAKGILSELGLSTKDIGSNEMKEKVKLLNRKELMERYDVGEYTLNDILDAFIAPQRDPRDEFETPLLRHDVLKLEDLHIGMELQGVVRNVVDFGAFIDCGVKEDGLVHISKLSNRYVKHPMDVVSVGDIVKVWVVSVDIKKGRLGLTMLPPTE